MTTEDLYTFGGNSHLLEAFARQGVRFLVVGGLAVKFYAPERDVDDLDVMLDPAPDNAGRVLTALQALGLNCSFDASALQRPKVQIPLKAHHYADLVTPDPDIEFAAEWDGATLGRVNNLPVRIASRDLLIRMKARGTRPKDSEDVRLLAPPVAAPS